METIVYKLGGPNVACKGKTFSFKGVKSEEEFKELLSSGWFATLEEALEGKKPVAKKTATKKAAPKKVEEE